MYDELLHLADSAALFLAPERRAEALALAGGCVAALWGLRRAWAVLAWCRRALAGDSLLREVARALADPDAQYEAPRSEPVVVTASARGKPAPAAPLLNRPALLLAGGLEAELDVLDTGEVHTVLSLKAGGRDVLAELSGSEAGKALSLCKKAVARARARDWAKSRALAVKAVRAARPA